MRIPALGALALAAAAAVVAVPTAANAAAPVANDDTAQAKFETAKVINVLANDSNPDSGESLSVTVTVDPAKGTVSCNSAGACTYTPATGWRGTDTFTYTLSDGGQTPETDTATVTVETGVFMITASSTPANLVAVNDPLKPALRNPTHKMTGTVTGSGSVPIEGIQVQLYRRTDLTQQKEAVPGAVATSNAKGKFAFEGLQPIQKTYYSWKSVAGESSSERIVTVTPFLTAKFGNKKFAEGGLLNVTGLAGPVSAGQSVMLQQKNAATGRWEIVETVPFDTPAPDNSATFDFADIKHSASGSFAYRVVVPEVDNVRNKATSGMQTIEVYDAKITNVDSGKDEFVTVKNIGLVSINLSNWKLSNGTNTVSLPKRLVGKNGVVRIHTGKGTNTARDLYLRRASSLWPRTGTITLTDNDQVELDDFVFGP